MRSWSSSVTHECERLSPSEWGSLLSLAWVVLELLLYFDKLFACLLVHRGLAPQNKPELQKVLENRKREQVLKAQKEEQEARKKRSDLEIELMKRQKKLEQVSDQKQELKVDLHHCI